MPLAVTTRRRARAHSERCAGEYGFPTRAGPALEPHAAGTKREGGEVRATANVHASERRRHGAVARHCGTSVTERGPQSSVRGAPRRDR